MKQHKIDFIPGAAELGDFDATSTTVGVNPADELAAPLASVDQKDIRQVLRELHQAPRQR